MKHTIKLITEELCRMDQALNNLSLMKLTPIKQQILEDIVKRRDELLFERDEVFKINQK